MNGVDTVKIACVLLLTGALGGGLAVWRVDRGATDRGTIAHETLGPPKIEQVRKLASLTTLRVPISHVQRSTISGVTGSTSVVLVAVGEVDVVTDLDTAQFDAIDRERQAVTLSLSNPEIGRPRLDHDRTRVFRTQRTGLWSVLPGDAAEGTLMEAAMGDAQRLLRQHAESQDLKPQARDHAEHVLDRFLGALGWEVAFKWEAAVGK